MKLNSKLISIISITLLFFFSLFIYAITLHGVVGNIKSSQIKNNLDQNTKPLELSPERGRFILTMSLGDNGSFSLSKQLADAANPDVGYYNGKLYVYFAPGISLFALPFYLIGKGIYLSQVLPFFMISIFAALNILFLFFISRKVFKLPIWTSLLVGAIYGFASTSWSYAITMYEHQTSVFFILSSFLAVWFYRKNGKSSWLAPIWVWLAYGLSIAIDYPNGILMLPIMIYLALSTFDFEQFRNSIKVHIKLSAIIASVVFFALIVLYGYFNYSNFGSPFRLSGSLVSYEIVQKQQLAQSIQGQQKLAKLAQAKSPVSFFSEQHLPSGIQILLFSKDRGLFLYMPIFFLALFGIWKKRKKISLELGILLSLIGINLLLYSSWGDPWGGWAFGPRYLIPSMSYLAIFVGIWVSENKSLFKNIILFILFCYSSAIALMGAVTTNTVPPQVESIALKSNYGIARAFEFLIANKSSSFIYNTYLSHNLTLIQFYLIILTFVILITFTILFIIPRFTHED